jgi:hypothetical protein
MKTLIIFLFALISYTISAQDEYKGTKSTPFKVDKVDSAIDEPETPRIQMSEFKKNVRIGGAFNLGSYAYQNGSINTQLFFVQASPQLTYVLSDIFEGGLTTSYAYTGSFVDINSHSFSAGPVLRAYFLDQFFIQVEGVAFYNSTSVKGYLPLKTINFNAFAGGGFVSKLSETSYVLTGVKVNLLKNQLTYNQHLPIAFTSIHFGLW